tara:strand:- start:464 stop:1327 length:864 start_codon:yes stop_codon:yes gene_type:complete
MEISSLWGIIAALLSGLFSSVAFTVQKTQLSVTPMYYYYEKKWWFGFTILFVSGLLKSFSYTIIPASVVVSLSIISLPLNYFFSRNKEKCKISIIGGTICIILGSVMLSMAVPSSKFIEDINTLQKKLLSPKSVIYHGIVFITCIILHYFIYPKENASTKIQLLGLSIYSSLSHSIAIVWAKSLLIVIININNNCCSHLLWIPYVGFVISIILGFWSVAFVEQKGLCSYMQTKWVPIHFITSLLSFTVAGILVFDEWIYLKFSNPTIAILTSSSFILIWGVVLVASS